MILAQHIVSSVITCKNDVEWIKKHIPYVIFPDAVRAFTKMRPYSHFTISLNAKDVTWWKIPTEIDKINELYIQKSIEEYAHLADYKNKEISNYIDIHTFRRHNQHLPQNMFNGIQLHLRQDLMSDLFIKSIIDCSRNNEDIYYYKGTRYSNRDIRAIADKIQKYSYYILAERAYRKFGLTCNSLWLQEFILPILKEVYSKDLYEAVVPYITIDETIDRWISNHDWSHFENETVDKHLVEILYDAIEQYSLAGNDYKEDLTHIFKFINTLQIYTLNKLDEK